MKSPYGRRRFFFPLLILLAVAGISFAVFWLWNTVLVAVVPVKPVTYWQALGLLILSRILFGGFKFGPPGARSLHNDGGPPWREKWQQMSDEERAKVKDKWRNRGDGRS